MPHLKVLFFHILVCEFRATDHFSVLNNIRSIIKNCLGSFAVGISDVYFTLERIAVEVVDASHDLCEENDEADDEPAGKRNESVLVGVGVPVHVVSYCDHCDQAK